MPVNAGPEYFLAEKKFLEARTKEEKIQALEEMIKVLPKHKGAHNLLAQLKKRLSILKKESVSKTSSKPRFSIRKEGSGQVCIIGPTQSGKSTLLNSLTNSNARIGSHPYTTKKPEVGMMFYGGVQIQLIEIPSMFDPESLSLVRGSDLMLALVNSEDDKRDAENLIARNRLNDKTVIFISRKTDLEKIKEKIWSGLGLIRVYTKSPGKEKDLPPITFRPGSTIKDVVLSVHKDFLKNFKFARVFNDTKFSGQKVGLDYKLKDLDVVEIHAS